MKAIKSETKVNSNGFPFIEWTLDIGYKFLSFPGNEISDTLWTKKGKPVKPESVTFKRAEQAVNRFKGNVPAYKI